MEISDNSKISIAGLSSLVPTGRSDLADKIRVNSGSVSGQVDKVSISPAAREMYAAEGKASKETTGGEGTGKQGQEKSAQAGGGAQGADTSQIDKLIKQMKEKIRKIKEELAAAANDDSEAGKRKQELLAKQLGELTVSLAVLLEKKIKALSSGLESMKNAAQIMNLNSQTGNTLKA